ncbi:ferrous iron transport protein B [Spirochaetia bacterium 38H-sp]|uniref:Ferrous iron transport protein B n=1 Tax=Rarispira pelagica TaxID=3141764 RepID=A0ABU9UBX7_9SPIR
MREFVIGLVGTPNTGKTSVFNALTDRTEFVGNWPGVTIERKDGIKDAVYDGEDIRLKIIDLPGIYAIGSSLTEERVAFEFVLKEKVDLVLTVIDGLSIEKSMFLTMQLIQQGLPMHIVITKKDLLGINGIDINVNHFSSLLKLPVSLVDTRDKKDAKLLVEAVSRSCFERPVSSLSIKYDSRLEYWLSEKEKEFAHIELSSDVKRTLFLLLFQGDEEFFSLYPLEIAKRKKLQEEIDRISRDIGKEPDIYVAETLYSYIDDIMHRVKKGKETLTITERIDNIVLHKVWGLPIFWGVLFLMFWLTTSFGGVFIDFFDSIAGLFAVELPVAFLSSLSAPGFLQTFIMAIGSGIQTVATFIPIIYILFFLLTILEDFGYMARAAFVADRSLRSLGLSGKAFVPLLLGFGCTVSSVLATKTLETKKEKIISIFMAPLMSCGARLPVYVLFASMLFPRNAGLVVFSLYFVGIILAVGTGFLLKSTLFKGKISPLVMELPPYHLPKLNYVLKVTWIRFSSYIKRAGIAITTAVFILTLLNTIVINKDGIKLEPESPDSILIKTGQAISPVFRPMGIEKDNWPAVAGLFTGLFAKETIIGTLQSMYASEDTSAQTVGDVAEDNPLSLAYIGKSLLESFKQLGRDILSLIFSVEDESLENSGALTRVKNLFTPQSAYAYLLFVLIYSPCIATIAAISTQMGKTIAAATAIYLTLLAWILATLFYQLATMESPLWLATTLALILFLIGGLFMAGRRRPVMEE